MLKKKIFIFKLLFSWILVLNFFYASNVFAFELTPNKLYDYSENLTASVFGTMGNFFDYIASFFSDDTEIINTEIVLPDYNIEDPAVQTMPTSSPVVQVAVPVNNADLRGLIKEILNNEISYSAPAGSRGPQGERGPQGSQGPQGPAGPSGSSDGVDTSYFVSKTLFDAQNNGTMTSIENGIQGISSSISESIGTEILKLNGATSGTITIQPTASAGTYTLTLPTDDGTSGQMLTTDGAGILSWSTATSSQWTTTGSDIYYTTGNVGIGTTDLDGTPAIGRFTIKGSTNDGSTNILVGRDSDEANVFSVNTDGVVTASSFVGALTGNANTVTGLSVTSGKTLTVNNSLTFSGTDSTTMTFPSTSATIARTDGTQTFTGNQTFNSSSGQSTAFKVTDGTNNFIKIDTRTTSSSDAIQLGSAGFAPVVPSSSSALHHTATIITPNAVTFTGTTQITGTGASSSLGLLVYPQTLSSASALTINESSGLLISGAPIAAGSGGVTLTSSAALRIPAVSVVAGSGVVTNAYAIYADAPTGAANNYAAVFSTGNVGIGDTTPDSKLDVEQTHSTADVADLSLAQLTLTDSGSSIGDATRNALLGTLTASGTYNGVGRSYELNSLKGNATYSGTLNSGGNANVLLLSGLNGQASWSGTVGDVSDSASIYGVLGTASGNMGTTGTTAHYGGYFLASNTADTNYGIYASASGATNNYAAVFSTGNVGIGDTTPDALLDVKGTVCLDINADDVCDDNSAALSDERLKINVNDLMGGLDAVKKLRPVRFTWNGDRNTGHADSLGFIAQEVEAIFPELVITDILGYKNLEYSKLTAVLTKAVQELNLNLEGVAGTLQLSSGQAITPETESFMASFFDNVKIKIGEWLADAGNGVANIFAQKATLDQICLKDENGTSCYTRSQLDAMVSGGTSSASTPISAPEPTPDPAPVIDPLDTSTTGDTVPVVDPAPEPELLVPNIVEVEPAPEPVPEITL